MQEVIIRKRLRQQRKRGMRKSTAITTTVSQMDTTTTASQMILNLQFGNSIKLLQKQLVVVWQFSLVCELTQVQVLLALHMLMDRSISLWLVVQGVMMIVLICKITITVVLHLLLMTGGWVPMTSLHQQNLSMILRDILLV